MRKHNDIMPNPLTSLSELQVSRQAARRPSRRQPTPEQSKALETLAHAVEYLIDEGLLCGEMIDLNVTEAVHLLSQASRSAYLACDEAPQTISKHRCDDSHVRWKWMPSPPFMVPLFRDPRTGSQGQREA